MISIINRVLRENLKNIPGWSSKQKFVIFESDDWGSIRMPSKKIYEKLINAGIPIANNYFDQNDSIAQPDDLEMLFITLQSVKDRNGHSAVFSPFVNISNPDFEKIRESDFNNYFHETFFDSLDRIGKKEEVLNLWKQGMNSGIFEPAFHGREHLNVSIWMQYLKNNDKLTRIGFDYGYFAVPVSTLPAYISSFRPALYFENAKYIDYIKTSLTEGIILMQKIFGVKPKVFCPTNGISHNIFDELLFDNGIESIVTNFLRSEPTGKRGLYTRIKYPGKTYNGTHNIYIRNCSFEPAFDKLGINYTIRQIETAFRWHKPAVINTHRVNYIGSINPENRTKGLNELKKLLKVIIKKWPDVEFISSNDLTNLMNS
jgi:hypothetical protein